jgi:murein DD-endopeptidase MepM/ murein hydrolase activator NlpD
VNLDLAAPLASMLSTEGWGMPREGRPYHGGVDLRAPVGTVARAASSGTVVFGGQYADGSGGAVELDHGDGVATRYLHLSRVDVKSGQRVSRGQQLGLTGFAVSPHLHWDTWVEVPKLYEYVQRFGKPTTGFTVTKAFGPKTFVKVPAEPLAPMSYQADVIAAAQKYGVKLYSASTLKTVALLALLGVAAYAGWTFYERRRRSAPLVALPPA